MLKKSSWIDSTGEKLVCFDLQFTSIDDVLIETCLCLCELKGCCRAWTPQARENATKLEINIRGLVVGFQVVRTAGLAIDHHNKSR